MKKKIVSLMMATTLAAGCSAGAVETKPRQTAAQTRMRARTQMRVQAGTPAGEIPLRMQAAATLRARRYPR